MEFIDRIHFIREEFSLGNEQQTFQQKSEETDWPVKFLEINIFNVSKLIKANNANNIAP